MGLLLQRTIYINVTFRSLQGSSIAKALFAFELKLKAVRVDFGLPIELKLKLAETYANLLKHNTNAQQIEGSMNTNNCHSVTSTF